MKFINQQRIMSEVSPLILAIKTGNHQNLLFQGPAGCGKTTIAKYIANQTMLDWDIQIPVKGSINYKPFGDYNVHIIDEIHKFREWEMLYPYLDKLEETFIFCTTEYGESPEPFLSRCIRLSFEPYSVKDLSEIVRRYSIGRRFKLNKACCSLIGGAARGSPRLAKQRYDRVKMMLQYYGFNSTSHWVEHVLNQMGIYTFGYTTEDFRYLEYLQNVNVSSLNNLARALRIDRNTIEKEVEPFLLEKENILITSKGRKFIKWPETKITNPTMSRA